MFPNEILTCDQEKNYGFRWAFDEFGRGDMVDFFCSLPGVYNMTTGGRGKTVAGGSNKDSCKSGGNFSDSYYVVAKNHNLRTEAKAEFAKSDRGRIAGTALTNPDKYLQYWLTFSNVCKAQLTTKYPTNSDPAASDGSLYKVTVVNQNGDIVYYLGNTGGQPTKNLGVILDANHSTPDITCGQLADGLKQYAPAYSAYLKGPGKNDPGVSGTGIPEIAIEDENKSGGTTGCGVEGVGWLVCPVMKFLGEMNDAAFGFLANSFLETKVDYLKVGGDTYNAWSLMRNIANVAFVIGFLVLIYSQITGAGISNYGIKKLIPKLIISAILVNVSFFVCQIAVDLSNILGYSIKSLFDSFGGMIQVGATTDDVTNNGFQTAGLIAIIIASGAILLMALSIPLLLASLLALIVILFILLARTALIILLIVISPLAFVAYLLPNTEQWFQKWRKTFTTLLLLFPIIGVVFGASSFAAQIVFDAGTGGDTSEMLQLTALGIATLPLFAVPTLLKGALAAAGNIGAKLSSASTKANSRISGQAKGNLQKSRAGQYVKYRGAQRERNRALTMAGQGRGSNKNPLNWKRNATAAVNRGLNENLPGKFGARLADTGIDLATKESQDEVNRAAQRMEYEQDPRELVSHAASQLRSAMASGDVVQARAAQKILLGKGAPGISTLHSELETAEKTGSLNSVVSTVLRSDLSEAGLKGKDSVLDKWATDGEATSLERVGWSDGAATRLNEAELAGQTKAVLEQWATDQGGGRTVVSTQQAQRVVAAHASGNLSLDDDKLKIFETLANRPLPPTTPPPTGP